MLKSRKILLVLSVAASVFLMVAGCGGGGGGNDAPPPSSADVSITKTVIPAAPEVGDQVVFTLRVSNAGPAAATGVVVTDQLPSGFTYVSDDSGGAYNPVTGVWSVNSLAVGASQELKITATVEPTGSYINLAEVTASNDTITGNNNAGVSAPPPAINVSLNQIQVDCNTKEVQAFATVVDQSGNSIISLGKDDFTVTENQTVLTPPNGDFDVEFVDRLATPISVAIVLDYSQSIFDSGQLAEMENAAIAFVDELLDTDRAEIIKFNATVQVVQPFTSNKAALKAAIQAPFAPQAVTELYKAILQGIDDAALEPAGNRKAVVYFTDGRNNPDLTAPFVPTLDNVISAANDNATPIFGIVLGTNFRPDDIAELTRLSDESGGIFYPSFQPGDLDDIYQQLANTLLVDQYVFTYISGFIAGQPTNLTIEADLNGLTDSDTRQFTCP